MFQPAQLEQLYEAMLKTFNTDSLRQLLRFKLGKVLCNIVDCARPFRDLLFDLLMIAEEEGWLFVLLSAIAAARSNSTEVVGFMMAHAPQVLVPVKPGSLSEKVKTGLEAVVERKNEPAVQQVLDRFHAELRAVHDGVTALNRYKKLHDRLRLQVMLPQQLEEAAEEVRRRTHGNRSKSTPTRFARMPRRPARKPNRCRPRRRVSLGATLDKVANLIEQATPGKPCRSTTPSSCSRPFSARGRGSMPS